MNPSTYSLVRIPTPEREDARRRELLHHLSPEEMEQTLSEYARRFKLSPRERARLLASSVTRHVHDAGHRIKQTGKQAVKHAGARLAHAASHKLMKVAARIEQRASRLDRNE